MTLDRFDYQGLVQDALRAVVRRVLEHVSDHGLPGVHHFYITYDTRFPGVTLSPELLAKYPEQITIVLQHDYRNLVVEEDRFSVTLHFGGLPQRIVVPFRALSAFYDPSEQFALRFEPEEDPEPSPADGPLHEEAPAGSLQLPVRAVLEAADRMHAAKEAEKPDAESAPKPPRPAAEPAPALEPAGGFPTYEDDEDDRDETDSEAVAADERDGAEPADAEADEDEVPVPSNVVSIDAFRRK